MTEENLSQYSDYTIGRMTEESRIDSRQKQDCFLGKSVQTSSGSHPTSYSLCIEDSLLGIKQLQCEAVHSPPSITKLYTLLHPLPSCTLSSIYYQAVHSPPSVTKLYTLLHLLPSCTLSSIYYQAVHSLPSITKLYTLLHLLPSCTLSSIYYQVVHSPPSITKLYTLLHLLPHLEISGILFSLPP